MQNRKRKAKQQAMQPPRERMQQSDRLRWTFDRSVPTQDFLAEHELTRPGELDEVVEKFMFYLNEGRFELWEAVVAREQGLGLTRRQRQALEALLDFSDGEEERVLYIDEMPRPSEPWHPQTLRRQVRLDCSTPGWVQWPRVDHLLFGCLLSSENRRRVGRLAAQRRGTSGPSGNLPRVRSGFQRRRVVGDLCGCLPRVQDLALNHRRPGLLRLPGRAHCGGAVYGSLLESSDVPSSAAPP